MQNKKSFSLIVTSIVFTILASSITPVVGQVNSTTATSSPKASASSKASASASASASATVKATPTQAASAIKAASSSASPKSEINGKATVYKGVVDATPSAVGKFLVKVDSEDKNVDTTKSTKVYVFDKGKTVSTVSKLKVGDNVAVIGDYSSETKTLTARFILVLKNPAATTTKSLYGTVSSRDTTDTTTFILTIKGINKDDKEDKYVLNINSAIKVKDIDAPKLGDIKIGDRVTLTYSEDTETGVKTITRIFAIPGRAAGLLRDMRDSDKSASDSAKPKESAAASASSVASPTATAKATATPKATTTAKPTKSPNPANQ